jgi:peptidoglycan hydrolase-like protein with peptidoglycan-binding domain
MRNIDVEELYEIITEGTTVKIVGPVTGVGKGEFKNLSFGSKGNLVQLIQERLKAMKLYTGKIDGKYDLETERAVKEFQKINHLPITGGFSYKDYILFGLLE